MPTAQRTRQEVLGALTAQGPLSSYSAAGNTAPNEEKHLLRILSQGEVTIVGLVPWSSNHIFLAQVTTEECTVMAVYKPSRGARPLWDFDTLTLCQREVAAYQLATFLGWPNVPPTVLRSGPYGLGSIQLFVEHDPEAHYFSLRDEPSHTSMFQRVALFDYLINNADRKGGHVLRHPDGAIWAIDHGLTFHPDYKLRTVIWEHAGQAIPIDWLAELRTLQATLEDSHSALAASLGCLLAADEIAGAIQRTRDLLLSGVFPLPRPAWRNTPYPLI